MTLSDATVGKTYKVITTGGVAKQRRRLFDLGLLRGTKIRVLSKAPFGGTVLISLRSYCLTLRSEAAALITVAEIDDKNENGNSVKLCRIDRVVLSRFFALPIFILIMATIFFLAFGTPMQRVARLFEKGIDAVRFLFLEFLNFIKAPSFVSGLVVDGIIGGVGAVLVFLPQITALLFLLEILDESGYAARAAYTFDGLLGKIGLSGRTVFTLLSGLGCSVSAIMSTRGMEDEAMRRKTIIVSPYVSCSARLPVFTMIASTFFVKGGFLFILALYVIGFVVAIASAALHEKYTNGLKSKERTFIMELPDYRFPPFKSVVKKLSSTLKTFLFKIGTLILALNVVVYMMSSIFIGGSGKSLLEAICAFFAPLFVPLGYGNWKAVSALFSGFVAKETVVSTIDGLGGLQEIFTGEYVFASALAFAVYVLLYVPCLASVSAQIKEIGVKWTIFAVANQLIAAYAIAALVRILAILCSYYLILIAAILVMLTLLLLLIYVIKRRKYKKAEISLTKT